MQAALTIGVFDSGVGGLSIYREVRARLPAADYRYCLDNEHFPYGLRTAEQVVAYTLAAAEALVVGHGVNLLIIACNTASTVALPHLRALLPVPVIGVVPAIKPAAAATRSGTIGILATAATVQRPYLDELIAAHAPHCQVVRVASQRLVDLAERKLRGEALPLEVVREETAALYTSVAGRGAVDCVVLGCTHFPLLAAELAAAAPYPVQWLDSGAAIAARTAALAEEHGLTGGGGTGRAFCTRYDEAARRLEPALQGYGLTSLSALPLPPTLF